MNTLLLSSSNKAELCKAFHRYLNPRGAKLITCDASEDVYSKFCSDKHYTSPLWANFDQSIQFLTELIKYEKVELIVPTSDRDLEFLLLATNVLKSEFSIEILMPISKTVETCLDKIRFIQEVKLDSAKQMTCLGFEENIEYPVFARPRRGSASVGTYKIESKKQLSGLLNLHDNTEYLLHPLIDSAEISIDAYFSTKDGELRGMLPRERKSILGGEAKVSQILPQARYIKVVEEFGRALKIGGQCNIQLFDDGDQMTLIECNPRFGGASVVSMRAGLASIDFIYNEYFGEDVTSPIPPDENAGRSYFIFNKVEGAP